VRVADWATAHTGRKLRRWERGWEEGALPVGVVEDDDVSGGEGDALPASPAQHETAHQRQQRNRIHVSEETLPNFEQSNTARMSFQTCVAVSRRVRKCICV
jgi:hypothetical protein